MGWSVKTLDGLKGEAFEVERRRILDEFFMSLPPKSRQKALMTQFDVDEARLTLSPKEFDVWLSQQLAQRMNSLLDHYATLAKVVNSTLQQPL